MLLTLIRHGESIWNATNRWQGQSDVELSPRGQIQARALAGRLFGEHFDHRVSSDLVRAADTADALGGEWLRERRFREIDVGEWAGLSRREAAAKFPEQMDALRAARDVAIGGGESMRGFEARVVSAIESLAEAYPGREVILVTHGGVIRTVVARALAIGGDGFGMIGAANTSINRVSIVGGQPWRVAIYNDTLHIDPADRNSSIFTMPPATCRLALVAVDPDAEVDRSVIDQLLSALAIPLWFATDALAHTRFADEILAEPLGRGASVMPVETLRALAREHLPGSVGLIASAEEVSTLVAGLLGQPERAGALVPMEHGSAAQLRMTEAPDLVVRLHSYGVGIGSWG